MRSSKRVEWLSIGGNWNWAGDIQMIRQVHISRLQYSLIFPVIVLLLRFWIGKWNLRLLLSLLRIWGGKPIAAEGTSAAWGCGNIVRCRKGIIDVSVDESKSDIFKK